ncbi:MAG TPA: aldose epimerase [Xanthomonadaceae bacterium]|nr:aldose epimerase [Xanthomonadaceae bacterium]
MDDVAQRPLSPGPVLRLGLGELEVVVAPQAGGRLAQVVHEGRAWLVGPGEGYDAAIAWGCYPMLPWAGRIRNGRFGFGGRTHRIPPNLGAHAIHGLGFDRSWQVEAVSASECVLTLALPEDAAWPFGGRAEQRIRLGAARIQMQLLLRAGTRPMPMPVLGWHPWLRKPEQLQFGPEAMYPRDSEGIATLPLAPPTAGPWDDCFVHRGEVRMRRDGAILQLASDCDHWVVYDQPLHATCVEPQTGPPDAFNLRDSVLHAGQAVQARFEWSFLGAQ